MIDATGGATRGEHPVGRTIGLADEPHHDGSERYTAAGPHALGSTVRLRLRVPASSAAARVRVRSTPDAEPLLVDAQITGSDDVATWWEADLRLHNPFTHYRFLLEGGTIGYAWVNQAGVFAHDVTDAADFAIVADDVAPSWLSSTVGYQIFIDRFAASATPRDAPDWAVPADWDTPLARGSDLATRQWFGGDLSGIEERLDHLVHLGVDLIYLTPFFPARSSHRYDASSFDHVDPLLGGDPALASLVNAAHARGIRVIGDITLNHTGDHHDWFERGRRDRSNPEAGFYMFDDDGDGYVSWHDVASLPKLDHRSRELADRLYAGADSVIARFLRAPFHLDGWRVDCANTTGRWRDIDLTHDVAAATRATLASTGSDPWLLAEHCYDAGDDLRGGGWHGVMAYQWFTRPIWSWLRGEQAFSMMSQVEAPQLDGTSVVGAMRHLAADVPWAARAASMTMLDSHDSARFRSAVGDDHGRHLVGVAALLTMPGVPTLFAGSEVGVAGDSMDTCRVPFPWDEVGWDRELLDATRRLAELRRTCPELQRGSMRWLDATADSITFVRELADRSVIVHLNRADTVPTLVATTGVDTLDIESARTVFGREHRLVGGTIELPGATGATIVVC